MLAKMGSTKDRNGMELTEAEDIKKKKSTSPDEPQLSQDPGVSGVNRTSVGPSVKKAIDSQGPALTGGY